MQPLDVRTVEFFKGNLRNETEEAARTHKHNIFENSILFRMVEKA